MKFYSEKTKKLYETEEELKIAEEALQAAKDSRELTRKQLAKKIEEAQERVHRAEEAYTDVEKQVEALIEETKKTIEQMYEEPTKELRDAQKNRVNAIREFNDKFGVYTISYSGDEAEKEFDRLWKSLTEWNPIKNIFRTWMF